MAMNESIEEILLRVKAEGRGELDAIRQAYAQVIDGIVKSGSNLADGAITAQKYTKEIAAASRTLNEFNRLLEKSGSAGGGTAPEMLKLAEAAAKVAPEMTKLSAFVREQSSSDSRRLAAETKANMDGLAANFRKAKAEEVAEEKKAADAKDAIQRANLARLKAALAERTRAERETRVELERDLNKENDRLERQKRNLEQGKEAANKFGYGLLHVAHAVQDAQYGFGAVLNNIPLVVQALGGGPGLAGTVMVAGVGLTVFGDKLKQVGREMGLLRNPADEAAQTIEQMRDKVAALVEKPWKIDLDFRSIERAQKELSILEARQQALDAAIKKQTPMQQKSGAAALDAISQFAGEGGERGGTENLNRIVAEAAGQSGLTEHMMELDPRQKRLKELRRQAAIVPTGATDPGAVLGMLQAAAQAKTDAVALEAQIREDTRQGVVRDTVGAGVLGNPEAIDNLLRVLESPEGERLRRGDPKLGIKPVDPQLMDRLREARPGAIKAAEEEEQRQAVIDQEFDEKIASMRAATAKRKAMVDRETAAVVSGKAEPIGKELREEILMRVKKGEDRDVIGNAMVPEVMRRLGNIPFAEEAARKIVRQIMEKLLGKVGAAADPGMGLDDAAGKLINEDRADFRKKLPVGFEFKDPEPLPKRPVTPFERAQQARARVQQARRQAEDDQRQARLANAAAYMANQFGFQGETAEKAGRRALELESQLAPRFGPASTEMAGRMVAQEFGVQGQQRLDRFNNGGVNPRRRRGAARGPGVGGGFRSIPVSAPDNRGGGPGTIAVQAQEAATLGAVGMGVAGLTAQQAAISASLAQTRTLMAQVVAQQRATRQQAPSLLRAPMPANPR